MSVIIFLKMSKSGRIISALGVLYITNQLTKWYIGGKQVISKDKVKGFIIGVVTTSLIVSGTAAFADPVSKNVMAYTTILRSMLTETLSHQKILKEKLSSRLSMMEQPIYLSEQLLKH
jgi:hypothetical protein